jgi:hypothetical protein
MSAPKIPPSGRPAVTVFLDKLTDTVVRSPGRDRRSWLRTLKVAIEAWHHLGSERRRLGPAWIHAPLHSGVRVHLRRNC